jgi:hypothetical protein
MTDAPKKPPIVFKKRQLAKDIGRLKAVFYGPPKIGKSTTASKFPGALFLCTEEGVDWLDVPKISVVDWNETEMQITEDGDVIGGFCNILFWLMKEKPKTIPGTTIPLRTLVIDTVDLAYLLCEAYMCAKMGISSPSDLEYGKAYAAIGREWSRVLGKASQLGYGMIFLSHAKMEPQRSKARTVDIIRPSLPNTGWKVVEALVDTIAYLHMDEYAEKDDKGELTGNIIERRLFRTKPGNNIPTGDRTGFFPGILPLDYNVMVKYFPDTPGDTNERIDSPKDPESPTDTGTGSGGEEDSSAGSSALPSGTSTN